MAIPLTKESCAMPVRHVLGRARRSLGYRHLARAVMTSDRPVVGYVGWTGEGNLGDEAMFAAHQAALGFAVDLVPVPIMAPNPVLSRLGPRLAGVILGGGTLIGNGFFREGLQAVMAAAPQAPRFMVGTGSESLDYRRGNRAGIDTEFAKWVPLLAEFDAVNVRGPLSVEAISRVGVRASVVGDPALLLPQLPTARRDGLLGVNVGVVDDQWGTVTPDQLLAQVVDVARRAGRSIRLIATTAEDLAFFGSRAAQYPDVEVPDAMPTLPDLLRKLGECERVVAVKLHAGVLAASQGVPVVALEYRPKCRDFMMSIESEATCIRLDQFDADQLADQVIATDPPESTQAVEAATQTLRTRLETEFARVVSVIG